MPAETAAYRVFTRRFDREVHADRLDRLIGRLGVHQQRVVEDAWRVFTEGTLAWRTSAELRGLEASQRIHTTLSTEDLSETAATLLVDQSGSMRGRKVILAAAAVDIARSFLIGLGIKVEVLGFTTRSWRGGQSRLLWQLTGRRRNPGRLNDLLHIVYSDESDSATGTGLRALRHMFRPDLLKENIDGEALDWAAGRLTARPAKRHVLVMLSDGAPVDDATLNENGADYLSDHLDTAIERWGATVQLAQLRIGEEFESPFSRSALAATPDDLANELIDLLEALITSAS